jgi:hypothetical protein
MGWKDLAKLGKDYVEAKKDELLTSDDDKKAEARARADAAKGQVTGEVGTSFLENVLPPDLAKHVTAARPENVAAREAERAAAQEAARRASLAGRATAQLQLTLSGEEEGTVTVTLPIERTVDDPHRLPDPNYPDDPPAMPWLKVVLEAADPVPVGSATLFCLSLAVPDFRGSAGRYDLADLYRRGEAGEIESWEVFDLFLSPTPGAGDTVWYYDTSQPGTIDVADGSVAFDLSMQSAMSAIRAVGTITWAG